MSEDVEFCSLCGTVLPLPGELDYVVCYNEDCKNHVSVSEFDGSEVVSQIFFNKVKEKSNIEAASGDSHRDSGPMVDRTCSACGNEKMSYTTRQTRSVDEGQTVFYMCPACNNQESEYSWRAVMCGMVLLLIAPRESDWWTVTTLIN